MYDSNFFKVAGHKFRLSFVNNIIQPAYLFNYSPFLINQRVEDYLFSLNIIDKSHKDEEELEVVGHFDDDIASISLFKKRNGDFRFLITHPDSKENCTMDVDASFKEAQANLSENKERQVFYLNNCLMLLYAFSTANLDTLLIHASVIINNDEGFVFLGKSGTGKSTHSELWMEHIEGSELLNDDNPIIRIIDGEAQVFGSPWSGKTACYKNKKSSLKGILKLSQAPENKIRQLSTLHAYANILPACSCMRWENNMMEGVHSMIEKLVSMVRCYHLNCLPDKEAALLSYRTMSK